jgi:hypothetical protein
MLPQYDLSAQGGGKTISITPGAAPQNGRFLFSGAPPRTGKLWNLMTAINIRIVTTLTEPTAGGTQLYWDALFNMIASVRVNCKLFGDLFVQQFISGTIAKHLVEFLGNGYCYGSVARQVIPATTASTTVELDISLPISQYWNDKPNLFALWNGWFEGGYLDFLFAANSAIGAFSTGAVSATPTTVYAWIEYQPSKELIIPPICHWRQYYQAASGGTRVLLQGVGNDGGLQGTIDGARLLASYYLTSNLGMGGTTTADNITGIASPWRDQELTNNVDGFFRQYLRTNLRGVRGTIGGIAAATAQPDFGTHPYLMGTEQAGGLNSANAYVMPLVAPVRGQDITKLQRVRGNYPIDFQFTTAPTTGQHVVEQCELKEFTDAKKAELIIAAGLDPNKVNLKRKLAKKNTRVPSADKLFCIPQSVVPIADTGKSTS